jgi:formylglycine-generating enzyme required for sulfatase activity
MRPEVLLKVLRRSSFWLRRVRNWLEIRAQIPTQDRQVWGKDGKEMVRVQAGEFLYGEDKQTMSLPEFWIDRTPVTNREFARFVGATGTKLPPNRPELGVLIPAVNGRTSLARTGDIPAAPGQISKAKQTIQSCR